MENVLDFYQAQHKYRQKQLKFVFSSILKLVLVLFIFLAGWWFGNSDNLILIQENEKILNEFNQTKNNLESKLTDIKLKLKESNLALSTQIIKDQKTDIVINQGDTSGKDSAIDSGISDLAKSNQREVQGLKDMIQDLRRELDKARQAQNSNNNNQNHQK